MRRIKKPVTDIYGIIGAGRFGAALAKSLAQMGAEIIVLDRDPQKIKDMLDYTDNAFVVSGLTKEIMHDCYIRNCDTVIICIGEQMDTSILTTLNAIELGVKKVIAKASSTEHGAVLEKLGAEVVYPERDSAIRLAKKLTSSKILEYITISGEVDITEMVLTDVPEGMTVVKYGFRNKYGLNLIALKHGDSITTDIGPDTPVYSSDTVVVCGKREDIAKFEANI